MSNILQGIFDKDTRTLSSEFSPLFATYFRQRLGLNFEFYADRVRKISQVLAIERKEVVELGCGFGVMALLFKQFGADVVVGVDMNTERVPVARRLAELTELHVDFQLGDIQDTKLPDESFDVAIANEVISHVADRGALFKEASRILRKDGLLFISDGANLLDVFGHLRRREAWINAEKEYAKQRLSIIREVYPNIAEGEAERLAMETHGMIRNEIINSVRPVLNGGHCENSKPRSVVRNPLSGYYMERESNPFDVKKEVELSGFVARVSFPIFSPNSITRRLVVSCLQALFPLSILVLPCFVIIAKKK